MLMMNNSLSKKAATTPGRHPKLGTFPSLLPSVGPRTGTITSSIHLVPPLSGKETVLLSGTFDTTSWKDDPSGGVLVQAEIADRLVGFLDVVLRGIEAAEQGWKEGGKQTMIWREELETCGEQQGSTSSDLKITDTAHRRRSEHQRGACRPLQAADDGEERTCGAGVAGEPLDRPSECDERSD